MTRVLSISSSRADVAILAPVWQVMAADPEIELHVMLTGMHLVDDSFARAMLPDDICHHSGGADLGGGSDSAGAEHAGHAMAEIAKASASVMSRTTPDIVLAIGDRLDMLPAVTAALPQNLPVAHLHGGELTLGAVDDRVRHALTKLSHLHFVSSVDAANCVAQMGEEPWRIHVTGAPGLDALLSAPFMERDEFARAVGFDAHKDDFARLRLVTVHPETNAPDPVAPLAAVLSALNACPAPTLFTAPNSDPGGADMRARIEAFVAGQEWACFIDTLGARLYPNAMRHAAVMLGNSSSGLIEAPLFNLPVINVGGRQDGRVRGDNVHDCPADSATIVRAMRRVDAGAPRRERTGASPYGDGKAGPRVAAVIGDLPDRERLILKRFATEHRAFSAPWKRDASTKHVNSAA